MKFIQIENGGYINVQSIQYIFTQYMYSFLVTIYVNGDTDGYVYKTCDDEEEAKTVMEELIHNLEKM